MRTLLILITLFTVLVLVGCSNEDKYNEEPFLTGYIIDKRSQQILIVSTKAEDDRATDGIE